MSDEADAVSGETYQGSHERNIAAIRSQAAAVKLNAANVIGECDWCLRKPVSLVRGVCAGCRDSAEYRRMNIDKYTR